MRLYNIMTVHKCERCNYTTDDKWKYNRHINRKNRCVELDEDSKKSKERNLENNNCIRCGKVYKYKSSLIKHMKICKKEIDIVELERRSIIRMNKFIQDDVLYVVCQVLDKETGKPYDNMSEFYEYFNYEPVDPDNVNGMLNYIITERGKAYDHGMGKRLYEYFKDKEVDLLEWDE